MKAAKILHKEVRLIISLADSVKIIKNCAFGQVKNRTGM